MISTNSNSHLSTVSCAFATPVVPEHAQGPGDNDCRWHLDRVTNQIDCPETKAVVRTVFQDMLRLLECLDLIEGHLRHVDRADQTFAFFKLIHDEARVLIDFIRTDALNCDSLPADLADTLDGISFALSHDLRRVFEADGDPGLTKAPHLVLSKVHRAHHVLTNCLQQSTVSLAIVFDSDLVGTRLFNNFDARYLQSLKLCQDLLTLSQLVEEVEKHGGESTIVDLMAGLEKFRNDSMEALMYSDWPQFESFCERIAVSINDSLAPVLHQFQCYLEALLGQVRMRAVLVDGASASFENEERLMSFENPAPLSSSSHGQIEETAMNVFAFA
ncbi:MAG: hypothetical protein M3539_08080 [Acidobacteriota bacterium]|nr:hypothetical protein [Acidobacteriota bacterium]